MANELDPDRAIQLAQDFEKKFPNSPVLSEAYAFAAVAYARKDEMAQAVEYGEKSLKSNPQNVKALLLLAPLLPQPQLLRSGDLDKEKKLADAESYAKRALPLIEQLPKQPNETDDQFRNGRRDTLPKCTLPWGWFTWSVQHWRSKAWTARNSRRRRRNTRSR